MEVIRKEILDLNSVTEFKNSVDCDNGRLDTTEEIKERELTGSDVRRKVDWSTEGRDWTI